ncbi:MAG: hypothetical protein Q7R56_01435 [Nanoarchaeota archaeon]|nr:hypothetical protein [Nanoarchaeota archaeon]
MQRGVIWVAAVLYTAIGLIAIGLLLTAALPSIEKLRDRNTYAQTKELIFTVDNTIRTVLLEGTASQRELNPLTITKGTFTINKTSVSWELPTEALIIEPSTANNRILKQEGNLQIWQEQLPQKGHYNVHIETHYDQAIFKLTPGSSGMPLLGTYTLLLKNSGTTENGRIILDLTIH